MGIQLPNVFSLGGKFRPLRLLGDASFERAFHRITRKIVGALQFPFAKEDACSSERNSAKILKSLR